MTIDVGVVDDSATARLCLRKTIEKEEDLRVVGSAEDPYEARTMILEREPDVLTLDLEMPRMDGLSFLEKLMEYYPLPVVIVSGGADRQSRRGIRALELGALQVIAKPKGDSPDSLHELRHELIPALRAVRETNPAELPPSPLGSSVPSKELPGELVPAQFNLVFLGASTGGTRVVRSLFEALHPGSYPPIFLTQHMPKKFTGSYAIRLDKSCSLNVREASSTGEVGAGEVLLAPGDRHLIVRGRSSDGTIRYGTRNEGKVCRQRPAVDPMFKSAASLPDLRCLGIILTGMGEDGSRGARALEENGGTIVVQDRKSCTVDGMPRRAGEATTRAHELSPEQIRHLLVQTKQSGGKKTERETETPSRTRSEER